MNSFRQTVLKAIQFDSQLRIGAIEIQNMPANRVLSAKFETGELSSGQCPPQFFFFLSLITTKITSDLFQAQVNRMRIVEKKFKLLTPPLSSFSKERETNRN